MSFLDYISQKQKKWVLGGLLLFALAIVLVTLWRWYFKPKVVVTISSKDNPLPNPPTVSGMTSGYATPVISDGNTMTFSFSSLLEQTFTHNKGRPVKSEVFDADGNEVSLAVVQTLNEITLKSNSPVTGTLYIY